MLNETKVSPRCAKYLTPTTECTTTHTYIQHDFITYKCIL